MPDPVIEIDYSGRILTTARLRLRHWHTDLEPFVAMNANARVMQFLPKALDRAESDAMAGRIIEGLERDGFGLWAVEAPGVADFIGYVGLSAPKFEAHFTPCVDRAGLSRLGDVGSPTMRAAG